MDELYNREHRGKLTMIHILRPPTHDDESCVYVYVYFICVHDDVCVHICMCMCILYVYVCIYVCVYDLRFICKMYASRLYAYVFYM